MAFIHDLILLHDTPQGTRVPTLSMLQDVRQPAQGHVASKLQNQDSGVCVMSTLTSEPLSYQPRVWAGSPPPAPTV